MVSNARIHLKLGDITKEKVDAIVNAANSSLMGGGGVDGAIHRVGGPQILEECKEIVSKQGRLPTGQAVITSAGNLPAKKVIHTVGPIWRGGDNNEAELLRNCYQNSLKLADEYRLKVIAFPSISTGAYRYPLAQAAEVAIKAVSNFLETNKNIIEVRFILFSQEVYQAYEQALREVNIKAGK
jgi:O-acetyl-ADP-ribose deacetylase (regulator of RNase III)